MHVKNNTLAILAVILAFPAAGTGKKLHAVGATIAPLEHCMLWRDPIDITSRDLYYGPGGKKHQPRGTFVFVKEDLDGTNPKFVVRDQDGVKWKVKLGLEARPETAASRIVWAAGYFANEDYFVADLQVSGMPPRLHRGQKLISPDGSVHNVRLKREENDEKKIGEWKWRYDPFTGTRELNGLRVLMALINNWDLKDVNNAVYSVGAERVYMVSDLGASFGSAGRAWPRGKAKSNLDSYRHSKFIRKFKVNSVDLQGPARPMLIYVVNPKEYISRIRMEWIGKNIPRDDARWMGRVLGQLSPRQIRDAFLAAGYNSGEVEGFAEVVQQRIDELREL